MWTPSRGALVVAACLGSLAGAERAATTGVTRTFAFEADKWFSLDDAKQGPITWHRVEIAHQKGLFTKSNLFRPGNAEYLATIEIRIEYSNGATHDYKGRLQLVLLDEAGHEIDGYKGTEDLDSEQKYQVITIKLSTLRYGLERAKQLRIVFDSDPE